MHHSFELFTHLPRLRRYARVICGGQAAGDELVVAVLQRLELGPFALPEDPVVGLFGILATIWQESEGTSAAWKRSSGTGSTDGDPRVAALGVGNRQAYLLVALEGFSPEQASLILRIDETEFATRFREASDVISRQPAADVLIVEDDLFVAEDLKGILREMGHRVCGIARTAGEAIALSQSAPPGLILCDISLADGSSGIVAVNEIVRAHRAPVVFITASPERLLTGKNDEPAFVIRKPYSPEQVRAIVGQVLISVGERQTYGDALVAC